MEELWNNIKNSKKFVENAQKRYEASKIIEQKINEKKLVTGIPKSERKIIQKFENTALGLFGFTFLASWKLTQRWPTRFFMLVSASLVLRFLIDPYFHVQKIETLAEVPTDAGQIARAIYLYKVPEHPKREIYQKISQDFKLKKQQGTKKE